MKILIACEFSGTVREAFKAEGFDAWSCDLLPTEIPGQHIQGNVLDILDENWDMMIAHPPCTYLANSGVSWLVRKQPLNEGWVQLHDELWMDPQRMTETKKGAEFLKVLLEYEGIPLRAVENPIMHHYAADIIGCRQDQFVQPHDFGHDASKATGFFLRGLPPLEPTDILPKKHRYANQTPQGSNKLGPSPDRWKLRSKTYEGIAKAIAQQWGKVLREHNTTIYQG